MKNKKIIVASVLVLLVGLLTQLLWLIIFEVLVVASYWLICKLKTVLKPTWLGKALKSVFLFLLIFCVAISVRLFLFEVFAIPSGSMEDTLIPGDKVVVDKLFYGVRSYRKHLLRFHGSICSFT